MITEILVGLRGIIKLETTLLRVFGATRGPPGRQTSGRLTRGRSQYRDAWIRKIIGGVRG
jgi:hypothetical protein